MRSLMNKNYTYSLKVPSPKIVIAKKKLYKSLAYNTLVKWLNRTWSVMGLIKIMRHLIGWNQESSTLVNYSYQKYTT